MTETKVQHAVASVKVFGVTVVAGITFLVGLVLIARVPKQRAMAQRIHCLGNLKHVTLSFRIFATDHNDKYPMQISTNHSGTLEFSRADQVFRHFQAVSNELTTPLVLTCAADTRKPVKRDFAGQILLTNFAALTDANISYFVSLDATPEMPQALLSGDRNMLVKGVPIQSGMFVLTTNSVVMWSRTMHKLKGNVALGDGGIQRLDGVRLPDELLPLEVPTNRLLFP